MKDAFNDKQLQDEMFKVAQKRDLTSKELLSIFHDKGYDGVSLRDCNRLLDIVHAGQFAQEKGRWAY